MILSKTFLSYYQISNLTFNFEISLFTVSTIIINLKEKATHAPPGSRQEVLPSNPPISEVSGKAFTKCPTINHKHIQHFLYRLGPLKFCLNYYTNTLVFISDHINYFLLLYPLICNNFKINFKIF